MTCKQCKHFEESETDYTGLCHWTPPAVLARLFGYEDQYDVPSAPTHEDWSCSEFKEKEK